jgi:hypothetical protein
MASRGRDATTETGKKFDTRPSIAAACGARAEAMELGSQAANHSFGVCCVCKLYYII